MQAAAGLVQQLADDLNGGSLELPMFPDSVVRIQRALGSKHFDIDEVIRIISSDPALAGRVLQVANSAAMRGAVEITEVRQAVVRMGNKVVQSSVVAFALRQAQLGEELSHEARAELKEIWEESVELAARCYVIASAYTRVGADEALLAGLLSVLGRLYILTKSQEFEGIDRAEMDRILVTWHPAISKAIAESWGMSKALANALESQLETDLPFRGSASLTEILAAARLILRHQASGQPLAEVDARLLQRLGLPTGADGAVTLEQHAEVLDEVRQSLRG
ncbi:MAG TPA: HDOD domain-containing protein [Gammaproteobacteria bacterium]